MEEFTKKVKFLIEQNKGNIIDSYNKYGGVYLARIDMGEDGTSVELELDDGNIAFSLNVKNNACVDCGHEALNTTRAETNFSSQIRYKQVRYMICTAVRN